MGVRGCTWECPNFCVRGAERLVHGGGRRLAMNDRRGGQVGATSYVVGPEIFISAGAQSLRWRSELMEGEVAQHVSPVWRFGRSALGGANEPQRRWHTFPAQVAVRR